MEGRINDLEEEKEDMESTLELMDEKIRKLTVSTFQLIFLFLDCVSVFFIWSYSSYRSDGAKIEDISAVLHLLPVILLLLLLLLLLAI